MTLHITNAYHATSGGVSTFYRALLAYANAHCRKMRLVVPDAANSEEQVGEYGIIYHVEAGASPVADTRYRVMWSWGASGRRLREILRHEQPDLVEISDKYSLPMIAGFLRKEWIKGIEQRPMLVGTSHERMDDTTQAYFGSPHLWRTVSRVFMKNYYFPMFDAHIANSDYTAQELQPASKGHRLPREIRVLPMGVDADAFTPAARTPDAAAALRRRADLPQDASVLLYTGRLALEKNLPLLVSMMDHLPSHFYLVLAGAGALRQWLETRGRRIRLIGHLQGEGIAQLYAGGGAFVHPNPREPFGIAPLEAMAAGLPLLAPNAGGVLSYATTENAWLSEPTPQKFAAAVQELFANHDERNRRARNARTVAEAHRWPKIAARFFAVFDEWLADAHRWRSKR
jgi:glycosyltransferase involved in cell wall biosynthesis